MGPTGPQGEQGPIGPTGPMGPAGPIEFYYQIAIPDGTGTDAITPGTFWYDTEYSLMYVYINDELSGYNWISVADSGIPGPIGPTGPAGPAGHDQQIDKTVSDPSSFSIFEYDSSQYHGGNFSFVEISETTNDVQTYEILVANKGISNIDFDIRNAGTVAAPTTINVSFSGATVSISSSGSGSYRYKGYSNLF